MDPPASIDPGRPDVRIRDESLAIRPSGPLTDFIAGQVYPQIRQITQITQIQKWTSQPRSRGLPAGFLDQRI